MKIKWEHTVKKTLSHNWSALMVITSFFHSSFWQRNPLLLNLHVSTNYSSLWMCRDWRKSWGFSIHLSLVQPCSPCTSFPRDTTENINKAYKQFTTLIGIRRKKTESGIEVKLWMPVIGRCYMFGISHSHKLIVLIYFKLFVLPVKGIFLNH